MTEEAHKSKKEPREEVVDTLNEAEEKGGSSWEITEPRERYSALPEKVLSTSFKSAQYFSKSFMHYLKKCSELLSSRNKKLYKGLSTFTFNISEWKSAQHYLKKCSALLSRRNKNTYKGLSTFTFNILDWKSAQPFKALLSSFIEKCWEVLSTSMVCKVKDSRIYIHQNRDINLFS